MKLLVSLFLILNLGSFAAAQSKPDSLYSKALKEKRQFKILLPSNYKPESQKKYDVVYILDGENNLDNFSQIHRFAKGEGFVPDLILVAVINGERNRDFTPTATERFSGSGGADKFISFFKQELIPNINKAYPTSGQNILYGHSLGGLFAIHTMLTDPTIFTSYIAVDPSLWYDNEYTNKLAIVKFKTFSQPDQTLFISGTDRGLKRMGITSIDSIFKISPPKSVTFKMVPYENETHNSVQFKSIYDGLKLVYEGYTTANKPIEYYPMNGIVLKDKPYVIHANTNFSELRYTTNGTVPMSSSPRIEKINKFFGPMKLMIKSFNQKGKYEKVVTGNFVLEEPPSPVAKTKNYKPGGLSYSYYEGEWDSLPDFKILKPVKSGIGDKDFNLAKLPSKNNFALQFEGMLEIKEEGYHLISIGSDDGSKLYIKDKLIINNDGLHGSHPPHSFLIPLKKGFYPVKLEYFQRGYGADLRLKYVVPGKEEAVDIPSELLYNFNGAGSSK
jgi:predicted alpha/beta superfamily hydrolase